MPNSQLCAIMSYREVIPKNLSPAEWIEVKINTGTQSTLQDLKTFETSGGYCYKRCNIKQYRNRFIYWRAYQDVLELSEVSLDISLQRNHLRLRFTDSAVLNVSLAEQQNTITLLVVTVSSVHRYVFPLKTAGQDEGTTTAIPEDLQSQSIFYDVNDKINDPSTFYVTDGFGTIPPNVAQSYVSHDARTAYFAVAYQDKLLLHTMNCSSGQTVTHDVKEPYLMPRFLSNLKGALIGRSETQEAAMSMAFSEIEDSLYILVLYRNNELRLWSVDSLQTVASTNFSVGSSYAGSGAQGPQNNQLRKINDQDFCLFISHDSGSEFICLSILPDSGDNKGIQLVKHGESSATAPQMDLISFDATTSHIWALWSNAEGDFHVSAGHLNSKKVVKWVSAALEAPPDRYSLTIDQGVNPREAYCSYIFHPGRFDRNVIAKALYMFRRVNMQFDVKQLSMCVLKEQVCTAVEDEIQNELKDFVVTDDEYWEIATRLWDRFYSCCEQYHIKFSEPTGLAVLGGMDAVCLVRRQSFALLRPCEVLEHLLLIGRDSKEVATFVAPLFRNDPSMAKGFVSLMKIVTLLDRLISDDMKIEMDKQLYHRESPVEVISKVVSRIAAGSDDNSLKEITQKFQDIPNLKPAVEMLLNVLSIIDSDAPRHDYSGSSRFLQPTGALFGSEYGLAILAETVKQMTMIRYSVCRNLLILQYLVCKPAGMETANIPTNINYLHCYSTLVWIADTPISSTTPAGFEASIQRLSRAQLFSGYTRPYSSHLRHQANDQTTLLSLFLQSKGLFSALAMVQKTDSLHLEADQFNLRDMLLQIVGAINKMLWPESPIYVFPEWLLGTCQHIIVQDYVRLLSGWCSMKAHARRFMLAVSLLDCGEPHKAVHLFQQTAPYVVQDDFLFEHVLKSTPLYSKLQESVASGEAISAEDTKSAIVHYYLKVIQLFEQHSALDFINQLANNAMSGLQLNDPQLPMFQSIVFNNHLQWGHYDQAYHALVNNADTSRRKDCLRQLVITLFQTKSLQLLMRFSYNGLQNEFESIVESRARSLSIDQNDAYNFLYAFHTDKGNMRKAATVMYEQAMRLQLDSDAPNALEKRCSSLLVCLNSLHLVDSRYRWIAKPTIGDDRVESASKADADEEDASGQEQVVVLELADIRRELVHAEALLELSHFRKDAASYDRASPEELSYLLASCGLYTAALKLSRGHTFSVLPIFESLTTACVTATEDKSTNAWSWLQNNDMADLPHRSNAGDMAWALLEKLLLDNEEKNSTLIRRSVVNRLLVLNAFVPQWLMDSYKLANSRELLHLFVKHNRLLEAADLGHEMIGAMLGAGCEYFDFKHSVNVTSPQLAFPINTIDLLLHALKVNGKEDMEYEVASIKLEEQVRRYIDTVKRTTEDKVSVAILQSREERQQQQQQLFFH